MPNRNNHHEPRNLLVAFADGELDVSGSLRVLEQMAMDPSHTKPVIHQQQLRQAVGRVMDRPEHRAPPELAEALREMADREPAAQPASQPPGVLKRLTRWAPTAAAAVLLLLATALFIAEPTSRDGGIGVSRASAISPDQMPTALVKLLGIRHEQCAEDPSVMLDGFQSPEDPRALPGAICDYLGITGDAVRPMNLSIMGFQYVRAANCFVPVDTGEAVHVLYKAAPESGRSDALSLWICPDTGEFKLDPDRIYTASQGQWGHPVLMWKRGEVIYIVVGDGLNRVQMAARRLSAMG